MLANNWLRYLGGERNKAISNGVTERHKHQSDECGNGVADVAPIDGMDLSHHHAPDLGMVS